MIKNKVIYLKPADYAQLLDELEERSACSKRIKTYI